MHPQDKTVLKCYKWLLQHPIWDRVLLCLLLAAYFIFGVVPLTLGYTIHKTALNICVFVPVALILAGEFFLEEQANKVLKRLNLQEAPVQERLQFHEALYADIDFSKRRYADIYRDYALAVAPLYMFIGEFDRAIELYQKLLSAKYKKTVPKGMRPVILGNLADCFAEKGDANAARNTMCEVDEAIRKVIRHNRKKQKLIEENINAVTRAKLELRNGNPAPMAAFLKEQAQTETANDPFKRIVIERLRGWTAYLSGDDSEAQRAYAYVSEHGKGTFYEQEAKYYLDKIREQNAN